MGSTSQQIEALESEVFCTTEEFLDTKFDYLIAGGGLSGLTLAARLSEDPNINVGVLEAGQARLDDPNILTPLLFTKLAGTEEYDWMLKTVPQAGTHGKSHAHPRGKVLGGSSAMNFMIYVRPQKSEFEDWVNVGAKGWSWSELEPYFRKHEGLQEPSDTIMVTPKPQYDIGSHGIEGPIKTSFPNWQAPAERLWHSALAETVFGSKLKAPTDAWSGDHLGAHTSLSTIDRTGGPGTRSYAVTGYLKPILHRKNLKILCGANVERVLLEPHQATKSMQAKGLRVAIEGATITIAAAREVILCTGAIKTPQVLELSGIGNPKILEKAGIECVVENDNVGENLQDHLMTCMVYELANDQGSLDGLSDPAKLQHVVGIYQSGQGGPLANGINANCFVPASLVANSEEKERHGQESTSTPTEGDIQQKMRKILNERLRDDKAASLQLTFLGASLQPDRMDDQAEFLAAAKPGQNRVTIGVALCHPFSRGSVHIESGNPSQAPLLDPAYLKDPTDLTTSSIGLRIADEVFRSAPLASIISHRVYPPESCDLNSLAERDEYVRGHAGTQYHPVGTAAIGSVVDSSLQVFGVKDLRVVDAGVFPMHISGNIQATVYAIAEKAADIIKNSYIDGANV